MLTALLNEPFFTGTTGGSSDVPGLWHVALDGRGFMLDLKSGEFRRVSIPLLRQQADQSTQPGESSINPDDLWRRTMSSFHHGAGQRNYDADDSDPARFYTSKGLDPWTEGELTLLPATVESISSSSTNLRLAVAGDYLYATLATTIKYTQDLASWSDITGESATAASSITSDGHTVYTSHDGDGVYVTTKGAGSTAKGVTGTVNGVKWVKGRLFGWAGPNLYNIIAVDTGTPSALPTALLTQANTDFDWVDVAEANGYYFPAGVSGDKSLVYKTAVEADGTALETPSVAAELPDGEIVRAIQGYVGFLVIGTSKGVRFGVPSETGDVTLGALISDATNVRCFEGQDRFVWFGWSNYDAVSTGLGRMDLSVTTQFLRPAYASDLMVTAQADVLSVATFLDKRVFTVSGDGIYTQDDDNHVPVGTLETGRISYGIFDPKVSRAVTVTHSPLSDEGASGASIAMELKRDGGDYNTIGGVNNVGGSIRSDFTTNRARGEHFELRLSITPDADSDPTIAPVVGRLTLRADPTAPRSERIFVPILISGSIKDLSETLQERDVLDDLTFLSTLEDSGDSFQYQEAGLGFTVTAVDHDWRPMFLPSGQGGFGGTYIIQLKRFATE